MRNPPLVQHTQALADYLPNGKMFEAKNIKDSNFRDLLRGLAGEMFNAQGYLCTLENEYFPDLTTLFIVEWERALAIPDGCFLGPANPDGIQGRRRDVVVKLAALGVQTLLDFEALADTFGVDVNIQTGYDGGFFFPADFPMVFITSEVDSRYTVIVRFINASPLQDLVQCLFEQLIPDNCQLIVMPPL